MKTNYKYEVRNAYFSGGTTNHKKIECAYKAASKREGEGWIVVAINSNGDEFFTCENGFNYFIIVPGSAMIEV